MLYVPEWPVPAGDHHQLPADPSTTAGTGGYLTRGLVMPHGDMDLGQHWLR